MKRLKLTKDGVKKLQHEIEFLGQRQLELQQNLRDAVSEGYDSEDIDLSLDYSELTRIENRIAELELSLRTAEIIETPGVEIVTLGHKVTIQGHTGELKYQLVESIEADPSNGKISVNSPLGQSLLGRRLKDVIEVTSKGGNCQYKIVSIH